MGEGIGLSGTNRQQTSESAQAFSQQEFVSSNGSVGGARISPGLATDHEDMGEDLWGNTRKLVQEKILIYQDQAEERLEELKNEYQSLKQQVEQKVDWVSDYARQAYERQKQRNLERMRELREQLGKAGVEVEAFAKEVGTVIEHGADTVQDKAEQAENWMRQQFVELTPGLRSSHDWKQGKEPVGTLEQAWNDLGKGWNGGQDLRKGFADGWNQLVEQYRQVFPPDRNKNAWKNGPPSREPDIDVSQAREDIIKGADWRALGEEGLLAFLHFVALFPEILQFSQEEIKDTGEAIDLDNPLMTIPNLLKNKLDRMDSMEEFGNELDSKEKALTEWYDDTVRPLFDE